MSHRILKNNTASPVVVDDTGITIPSLGQYIIPSVEYGMWEDSSNVVGLIGDETLTVNDGTFDLPINDGMRLIQGGFSRPIADGSDPTIKATVKEFGSEKRLLVESKINVSGTNSVPTLNNTLTYDDMNSSNGGVDRGTDIGTTFTNIYSYNGTGLLIGFLATLEKEKEWYYRLIVDGVDIFGSSGIYSKDLGDNDIYGYNFEKHYDQPFHLGLFMDKTLRWQSPLNYPIRFTTNITIKVKHDDSSKKFRGGLVCLTKE